MKFRFILLIVFLFFNLADVFNQSVLYTYDANGNRIERKLEVYRANGSNISFPISNPDMIKTLPAKESNAKSKEIQIVEGVIDITVYPNPNKGLLKVDILNMALSDEAIIFLYELSGRELIQKRYTDSHLELDLSSYKDGIYILRINIKNETFYWKILKSGD